VAMSRRPGASLCEFSSNPSDARRLLFDAPFRRTLFE
jgi:hypothetical protein